MYSLSEPSLEEQLKTKSRVLALTSVLFISHKLLKISSIMNLTSKMFTEYKKGITFTTTVPVLHTIRTASGSFFLYSYGN